MTTVRQKVSNAVLMATVAMPSLVVAVLGGVGLISSVSEQNLTNSLVAAAFSAGGFAGLWGSQTLSRGASERTGVAKLASAIGVVAFLILVFLMWSQAGGV